MKQKLASRKFWASLFAVVSSVVFIATGNELDAGVTDQLTELAPSFIALGYALIEGVVDAFGARANAQANIAQYQVALASAAEQLKATQANPIKEDSYL